MEGKFTGVGGSLESVELYYNLKQKFRKSNGIAKLPVNIFNNEL